MNGPHHDLARPSADSSLYERAPIVKPIRRQVLHLSNNKDSKKQLTAGITFEKLPQEIVLHVMTPENLTDFHE